MYGSAGRVGVIEISSSVALSAELPSALAPDYLAVFSRIRLPRQEVSVAALETMLRSRELELAAEQLADADVDLITFGCTSASFINGPGWDEQLSARIEATAGVPATTTTTAVLAALRSSGAQRIGVATPYPQDINAVERRFFDAAGFEVVCIEGLGLKTDREIGALSLERVKRLAGSVAKTPSDLIFLSCTNMPTLPLLADLEHTANRPIVSSNSATIWDAQRRLETITQSTIDSERRGPPGVAANASGPSDSIPSGQDPPARRSTRS